MRPTAIHAIRRAGFMTRFLDLSIHDLAVMVGLGCFTGSATNVVWNLLATSPAPEGLALSSAFIGFVLGKLVADRSGAHRHA